MLGGGGEDLMEPTCVRRRQRGSITLAKQPDWTKPLPLPVFPMIFISRNKTISFSCGDGNKTLDMMINSWISWTNNQRWRLLVMIRLWWCFQGVARNWLMSAAFRNGGAFSFLPPLPPASVKLSPSICYYPQQHFFTPFWTRLFLCVLNTSANAGQTVEMSITCCLNTESAPTWQTHHSYYPRREKRKSNHLFLRVSCCSQSLRLSKEWGGEE